MDQRVPPDWLLPGASRDCASVTAEWRPVFERPIAGSAFKQVRSVITGYGHLTEVLRGEWLGDNTRVDQVFVSTLAPGTISAWHAHERTTDRLFVARGNATLVLYDARPDSESFGALNEFRFGVTNPGLVIIPPRVWHGIQAHAGEPTVLINAVDEAYDYARPDHWRVPLDAAPYTFAAG